MVEKAQPVPRRFHGFKCAAIFWLACVFAFVAPSVSVAAPPNDNFANAVIITGTNTSLFRTNGAATKEVNEPNHAGNAGGKSVWFRWTAPNSGSAEWSTVGNSFDTLLAAYENGTNYTFIAANNNDGTNSGSRIVFNAISNSTYHIAVDGFSGASGSFSLTLTQSVGYFIPSNDPRSDFWTTDGQVTSIVETNGIVFVGGRFSYVAKKAFSAVALNSADSSRVTEFPFINGSVSAVAEDGANGFFVAGAFSRVGTVAVTNFVHVLSDLTVDLSFPTPNFGAGFSVVNQMEVDGSILYLNGVFNQINTSNRPGMAALEIATGQVTSWKPQSNCYSFVVADDAIYAFTANNNGTGDGLLSIDKVTGVATPFSLTISNGSAFTLALLDETLYVGGSFKLTNGVNRTNLLALSRHSGTVLPWNPNPGGSVSAIATTCDRVFVTGVFRAIGDLPFDAAIGLAALDPVTGQVIWSRATNGGVVGLLGGRALQVSEGRLFVTAGSIRLQTETDLLRTMAILDANTGRLLPQQPDLAGNAFHMVLSGSRALVTGGLLTEGSPHQGIAAFDSLTGRPLDWAPFNNATDYSFQLVCTSNRLFVAGSFNDVSQGSNSELRGGFAAFDLPSLQLSSWDPLATFTNSSGSDPAAGTRMALRGGLMYVAGDFSSLGSSNRNRFGAVNITNGAPSSFNVTLTNANAPSGLPSISAMSISGSTLFLGGSFTGIDGLSRTGLASIVGLTPSGGGAVSAWVPSPSYTNQTAPISPPEVSTLLTLGASVFAAGKFNQIGGMTRPGVAEMALGFIPDQPETTAWNPTVDLNGATGIDGAVLATDGRDIYLAGTFKTPAPFARTNIAAFTRAGRVTDWDVGFVGLNNSRGVHVGAGKIFATATTVTIIAGRIVPPLLAYGRAGSPNVLTEPASLSVVTNGGTISLSVVAMGQGALSYQWRRNGTNLPSATNPTFTLFSAATNDSGSYELIVSNPLGSVSSAAAKVIVTVPPTITSQPASQTVAAGATVTLSVTANGFPAPALQWRLNGVNIPGAIANTYTVTTNAQATNGGSYSVVVANAGGAVSSLIATVLVTSAALTFHDNLPAGAGFDSNAGSGTGSGNNFGATKQTGETNHVGKVGGSSVWFIWRASASGVATFRTRGSSFDTLLAVYSGTNVTNLTAVASDEDRGGFLTSAVSFSAAASSNYAIAVDGFAAAQGNIVLNWTNDTSVTVFPRILSQPVSQTLFAGETATFTVSVAAMIPPPAFQWFSDCSPVSGATNATLTITNVKARDVGNYYVRITTTNGLTALTALSVTASLQLGVGTRSISRDKLEDLFLETPGGGGPLKGETKLTSVSAGTTLTSLSQNNGSSTTSQQEVNHCDVTGGATDWILLVPLTNGVCMVDTIGTQIDTVLAVYKYVANYNSLFTNFIVCDDNGAPDRLRSRVRFNVLKGVTNLIVVDGVAGAKGLISVNVQVGIAPNGSGTTANQTWGVGQTLVLNAPVSNGSPSPFFQWRFNGSIIFNATNATFTIANLNMTNSGQYSVIVSNFAGAITNTVANVTVAQPFPLSFGREFTNGRFQLRIKGPALAQVVEATTNFTKSFGSNSTLWRPLFTNPNGTPLNYVAPATNQKPQLYRTRSFP